MAAVEVPTAGYAIARAPDSLVTVGIGSCLAICLYSQEHQLGALLHCMLPHVGQHVTNPCLYVDTALNTVLEKLLSEGIQTATLTAKLIGGAEMFPDLQPTGYQGIGRQNIEETTRLLQAIHIPIVASSTGGNRGKSILFDLSTGAVSVSTAFVPATQKI